MPKTTKTKKKTGPKKTGPKKTKNNLGTEELTESFQKVREELVSVAKKTKDKYDQADDHTKKAIIAGLAGAAALIAGTMSYKHKKNRKKK